MTTPRNGSETSGRFGGRRDRLGGAEADCGARGEMRSACATCPVRQTGICGRMGRERIPIALGSRHHDITAQTSVWSEDCDAPCFGIVVTGILRSVHYGYDGRRHVLGLIFPGELLGKQVMRPGLSLEAATDARICRLDPKVYAHVVRHSARFRDLVRHQTDLDLERLRFQTLCLGALAPEERLASFLVQAVAVLPWSPLPSGGGVLTLSLPRADIADLLGTSIESISRITHRFDREGVIRILDPRHFEIPDLARLGRIASLDPLLQKIALSSSLKPEGRDGTAAEETKLPSRRPSEAGHRASRGNVIPFRRH